MRTTADYTNLNFCNGKPLMTKGRIRDELAELDATVERMSPERRALYRDMIAERRAWLQRELEPNHAAALARYSRGGR